MYGSRKLFVILGALIAVLAIVLGTSLWLVFTGRSEFTTIAGERREPLTMYGSVPDFSLTERSGENVTLAHLRGKIWIADFIYTSCTDTCPLQTGLMARLQQEYVSAPQVQLVSVTVDPERDTPQTLMRYATRHQAHARRWFFLTGQRDQIIRLVRDGFHLSVAAMPDGGEPSGMIAHSPRFVLIDKDAHIRGYYDSRELEAFLRLKNDIETLLKG